MGYPCAQLTIPHRFYSPDGHREPQGRCLPCSTAPHGTLGCAGEHGAARSAVGFGARGDGFGVE